MWSKCNKNVKDSLLIFTVGCQTLSLKVFVSKRNIKQIATSQIWTTWKSYRKILRTYKKYVTM